MGNALAALFGEIASAIREKNSETGTMKPAEFPEKILAIETGGGETIVDGVDPYYQQLAEAVIMRDATYLSGDKSTLILKGFTTSDGKTLGNVSGYAFAGFTDVENIAISDTLFVYPYAFKDNSKLKILDVTAAQQFGIVSFFGNSLSGCTALESVIIRDGGAGLSNVKFSTIGMDGTNYGGTGANDTFYVYVPAEYYDTIVADVDAAPNIAVPGSRYRKLEDYPGVDHWNETYTVNF